MPELASCRPSGRIRTLVSSSLSPGIEAVTSWVRTSQSRTVPSAAVLAAVRPSANSRAL